MHFQFSLPRGVLTRRIVFLMILASAIFSTLAAAVQLYLSYQRDKASVIDTFSVIETSFKTGFENALWEFNFNQVEVLLNAVFAQPDVKHVELIATTGQKWHREDAEARAIVSQTLSLVFSNYNGETIEVGVLEVGLSLDNIRFRLWEQFWALILSNFIKTILASIVMLFLFEALVARHLHAIADYVRNSSWFEGTNELALERRSSKKLDDLDEIVSAINAAKVTTNEAFSKVEAEIAERRTAELALAEKASDLEMTNGLLTDINREQAEFTYAMSHELRSPTNTIAMLLHELRESQKNNIDEEGVQLIDNAEITIQRMGKIVEDVLNYSRSIDEKSEANPVSLDAIIEEILADLKGEIVQSGAAITFGDQPTVEGSRLQLRILFQNLISNAIKFMPSTRKPEIEVSAINSCDRNFVTITVKDNGIGIAPEYLNRIFGLFQRLHTFKDYPGTGVGLALCKRILSNHHGSIEVSSVLGTGSEFRVTLRRYQDE